MPKLYGKVLNETLKDSVAAQIGVDPREQCSLFEELALLREHAAQTVKLWSGLQDMGASPDQIIAAGEVMASTMAEVAKLAQSAHNITQGGKDQFSIHDLQFVIQSVIKVIFTVCEERVDGQNYRFIAEEIEQMIRDSIVMPSNETQGTTLTPDQDVAEMDASVPLPPKTIEHKPSD